MIETIGLIMFGDSSGNPGLSKKAPQGAAADAVRQAFREHVFFRTGLAALANGFSRKGMEITNLNLELSSNRWLRKKYKQMISEIKNDVEEQYSACPVKRCDKVWILWFQGEHNAPPIVQACIASIRENMSSHEVVVLDEDNLSTFVNLPPHVCEKYRKGIISKTHFSDLVRLELLTVYGGIWIDATVMMSGTLPRYIEDSNLFVFQTLKPGLGGHTLAISSWFISSQAPSKILLFAKDFLYSYWECENALVDYFLLHHAVQIAIDFYGEEWNSVPPVESSVPHALQTRLFEPFDKGIYEAILAQTSVHKLTYKFDDAQERLEGTYYEYLLS